MVSSPFGGVDGIDGELLRQVWSRLGIEVAGKKILDVGCGRGYTGEVVRELGGDYTGADFVVSRTGFRLARADAQALPFPDGSFDGVFCLDEFEHIPDPEQAAREFRRVLKPGGYFYLSAPNYGNVAGVVKKVWEGLGWYEKDTWAPVGRWQPQELETPLTARKLRRWFGAAGFNRITAVGHAPEVGLGLFPWTDHPRMPEAIQFRLQKLFGAVGPTAVQVWPGSSLHLFWKMEI